MTVVRMIWKGQRQWGGINWPCVSKGGDMEALYEGISAIPIKAVGLQGAILLVLVVAALIFKLRIPKPKK